jgi:hypothetical protein
VKDFLDRYPKDGLDAGTGPRSRAVCECGHHIWAHHQLGACMTVIRTGLVERYCACNDYRQAQP